MRHLQFQAIRAALSHTFWVTAASRFLDTFYAAHEHLASLPTIDTQTSASHIAVLPCARHVKSSIEP